MQYFARPSKGGVKHGNVNRCWFRVGARHGRSGCLVATGYGAYQIRSGVRRVVRGCAVRAHATIWGGRSVTASLPSPAGAPQVCAAWCGAPCVSQQTGCSADWFALVAGSRVGVVREPHQQCMCTLVREACVEACGLRTFYRCRSGRPVCNCSRMRDRLKVRGIDVIPTRTPPLPGCACPRVAA